MAGALEAMRAVEKARLQIGDYVSIRRTRKAKDQKTYTGTVRSIIGNLIYIQPNNSGEELAFSYLSIHLLHHG